MTNLQVEYNKLLETKRYNEAQLAETIRSHQANEAITTWRNQQDVAIAQGNLAVNQAKAQTEAQKAEEAARHNRATEELTAWSNVIQQQNANANTSNALSNAITAQATKLNANTNVMKMANDYALGVAKNKNEAEKNKISWQNLNQQAVFHADNFKQEARKIGETERHNKAVESETMRHNISSENLGLVNNLIGSVTSLGTAKMKSGKVPVMKLK